jgi:hypothetical protein
MAVTKEQLHTMAEMGNNSLDGTSVHELALEAQDAIDDTDLKTGEFTHTPTEDDPYAMIVEEASSAGKSVVYDIRNGEASIVNNNMLPSQLGKTDPETGKRIFTTRKADAPPVTRGAYLCLLHENHPDREYHKTLGLGTCSKSNLRTMLDVRTHAQNRHRNEWAAITESRDQEREDQERKIRELTISQLLPNSSSEATVDVTQPVEATPAPEVPDDVWKTSSGTCLECNWTNSAAKARSRTAAYYTHKKTHV